MNLLSCSNNTPDRMANLLMKKLSVPSKRIRFVPSSTDLPESPTKDYYLFLSPYSVKRNLDVLNSDAYIGTKGVVFSCPLDLYSYGGIEPLDYAEAVDIHIDAFVSIGMKKKLFDQPDREITFNLSSYTDRILERVRSFTSILTKLMSFVYTMPSSTHQTPVKELACSWLNSEQGDSDLKIRLDKMALSVPMSDKQKQRFMDILLSEEGLLYKKALIKCLNIKDINSDAFYKVAHKMSISAYELRYIKAVTDKIK